MKKALCTPDAAPDDSFGTSGKEKVTSFCHLLLQLVILNPNVRYRSPDVQSLNLFEDLFFAIKKHEVRNVFCLPLNGIPSCIQSFLLNGRIQTVFHLKKIYKTSIYNMDHQIVKLILSLLKFPSITLYFSSIEN